MAKAKSRRSAKRGGGRKASRATGRKKTARKTAARKTKTARKRKAAPRRKRAVARKAAPRRRKAAPKRKASRKAAPRRRPAAVKQARSTGSSRGKAPALNRERRVVREDDLVPTPPSSLDMDRSASSARSGRRELHERFVEHTDTSPAITGGDIDANWESASTVGDEAPGGDNPTPDQDIVDDIGRAVGLQYEDNEELKGEKKVADRDRKRWELDPASSEDYNDR